MSPSELDFSELWLTVYLLEAAAFGLLAGVLFGLHRTHRKAFLQAWSLAWGVLTLERALTLGGHLAGLAEVGWLWPATTGLALAHVSLLLTGAWFLVRDRGWSRPVLLAAWTIPLGLGVILARWALELPSGQRLLTLDAVVRSIAGAGLVATAAAVAFGPSPVRPPRTVGRRSTAALLWLTGLLQIVSAGLLWRELRSPEIGSMLALVAPHLAGLILEGLLTLGLVLWFYESDRLRLAQATQALAEAEAQRRHALHMESLGRLAGGVAHDFNNLLTAMSGHVELLLQRTPEGHPDRDDLVPVARATRRAARLVGELLAFARRQPRSPRPMRLHALLRENERSLQRLVGGGVRLELQLAAADPVIEADPTQILLTLLNLAANARDAMCRSGSLGIETRLQRVVADQDPVLGPGEYVELRVSDTGCGIPPENLERVFEPFFTTKAEQGTGLGLSSVYGIVRQCGGDVRVASVPGQGACFSLWFPLSQLDAESEEELRPFVPSAGAEARSGAEAILLVEDDLAVRRLAQRLLTRAGYRVHSVADADEALALVREGGAAFDLLLSDVHLRGKRGDELAREIRREHPSMRVVLTSGAASLGHDLGGLESDVELLSKPFRNAELLDQVRRALEGGTESGRLAPGSRTGGARGEAAGGHRTWKGSS